MPPVVMLAVKPAIEAQWRAALAAASTRAGLPIDLRLPGQGDPADVRYMVFGASGPVRDFAPYTGLAAILNIWAGVEQALANPTLPPDVPLCRMVEPGLTEGMTDYVVAHVMRHHMDLDRRLAGPETQWMDWFPPLSRNRRVGVLGLGVLGADAAHALAGLRFDVAGWSRRPRRIEGVACHHGAEGLDAVLRRSEILVCLLPRTAATENLLDAAALAKAPRGAVVINAGRGELIDDAALLAALDSGALGHATLDVFRTEPLPRDHPFRAHPRVTVTPHVASATRPETASETIISQISRMESGQPPEHVVDRAVGY
ncbi:MAG: NAD(P)-dependent oxidoreductase [Rubrimonas sp.]|uniref:NAD(P)-dependent oxidoreductase n=1 Tax=Rubrimonas sp. TaxID=2036015 RepID=UPI002FDD86DB